MKSPVVLFCDPAAATKQRAKLSQEGSYIPIFINIIYCEKNYLPSEHITNPEKREQKKAERALMVGLKKPGAYQRSISPVLTLIAVSTGRTKILPSPILPVLAAPMMVAISSSTSLSRTMISI